MLLITVFKHVLLSSFKTAKLTDKLLERALFLMIVQVSIRSFQFASFNGAIHRHCSYHFTSERTGLDLRLFYPAFGAGFVLQEDGAFSTNYDVTRFTFHGISSHF